MKLELLKQITNEELVAELQNAIQRLNQTKMFSPEHRECFEVIKLIKEEILLRMK